MVERPAERPAWIGHWIQAVIIRYVGHSKESGKLLDLHVQSTMNVEFVQLLSPWVREALSAGELTKSLALRLSGDHPVGIEFRHHDQIIQRIEKGQLAADMHYLRLESGWHCRLKLIMERSAKLNAFSDMYEGESIQLRLFDLESEQLKVPLDGKSAAAGERDSDDDMSVTISSGDDKVTTTLGELSQVADEAAEAITHDAGRRGNRRRKK